MKFSRKDQETGKTSYLLLCLMGLGVVYAGYVQLSWGWNLIVIPSGLLISLWAYKNFRKTRFQIKEIELIKDSLSIIFINGEKQQFEKDKIVYSLLVKKYFKPVRAIEIRKKGKLGFSKGKKIGGLKISKWPDLEQIAKCFIEHEYRRAKWNFGWGFGEMLMILSILSGAVENLTEHYVGGINDDLARDVGELGSLIDEERKREIESFEESEQKFVNKAKK